MEKSIQKTADVYSQNAAIAARIKTKLLRKLEREIDAIPDSTGSEMYMDTHNTDYKGGRAVKRTSGGKRYNLRDFAMAYKALTDDMPKETGFDDPLNELFRRMDEDINATDI